jgi:hypothetical protein
LPAQGKVSFLEVRVIASGCGWTVFGAQHQVIPDAGYGTNLDNLEAANQAMIEFLSSQA